MNLKTLDKDDLVELGRLIAANNSKMSRRGKELLQAEIELELAAIAKCNKKDWGGSKF